MTPDAALELSIEQLVSALNKKLFMECARVQSAMSPMSRVQVAALTVEVDALEKRARGILHEVISLRNSLQPSWASITSRRMRLAPLCLERAGAVPLAVDITIPDIKKDSSFLRALLPHAARVSHLSLTGYSFAEALADNLPGLFASSMPDLTSLELHQSMEPDILLPSSELPLPPVFRDVSKLRSLHLTRTAIYPTLFGTISLNELKLTGYKNPSHFGTFIEFLASNPNLETVVLDVVFVEGSVRVVPVLMAPLARLRRLSITCAKPIDAKGLLSCISLPRGAGLEVFCSQRISLDLCLPSPSTPIQNVLKPITVMRFQATPRVIHVFGSNGGSFSFRSPQFTTLQSPELHLFPTASVREFYVNVAPWPPTPKFLVPLFSQLPALETLVVAGASYWATGAFDSLAGQPPLCPSLKTIALFNCVLTSEVLKELEGVAANRKGSAAALLYRVVIVGSTVAPPDDTLIQRLRQHVPCVDVRVDDKLPDLS